MSLRQHVRSNDWNSLEEAWTEVILGNGSTAPVLDALLELGKRKEMPRCLHLVREHGDALATAGRHQDAAELLGLALLKGGSPGELGEPLLAAASGAWKEEPWWTTFTELTGFREGSEDIRGAWRSLARLRSLRKGGAVNHPSGWGVGVVEEVHFEEGDVAVRFVSGRSDRIPLASALDIFDILEEGDPRALLATDPDELKRLLKEEPLEILRDVLRRYENRILYAQLRTAMAQLQIDGSSFTGWWRKARKQAETSEWFEVTGTATKTTIRLLTDAADPVKSFERQLRRCPSLAEARKRVRELVAGAAVDEKIQEVGVATLEELVNDEDAPLAERLSTWLFLREARGATPEALTELVNDAAAEPAPENPADRPALWTLFALLPAARDHEACLALLPEIFGEEWLTIAARDFPHAPHGMARSLRDKLIDENHTELLAEHYRTLLARPIRNPQALVVLAERAETGAITGEYPPATSRLESLVRLAGYLKSNAPGDVFLTRTKARLTTLLAGDRGLLSELLTGADRVAVQALHVLVERGVDGPIDSAFTNCVVRTMPDFFRRADLHFWEGNDIWNTRRGIEAREAELNHLKEVKIPDNAEAIGKAASFGDLSENSEWESALEEQRNLTEKAQTLEEELRRVQLLENAPALDDTVCPGAEVRYREVASGEEHTIQIVGPWDTDYFPNAISYRAPISKGLLGLSVGGSGTLELPTGTLDVEVLAVAPLKLEGRETASA